MKKQSEGKSYATLCGKLWEKMWEILSCFEKHDSLFVLCHLKLQLYVARKTPFDSQLSLNDIITFIPFSDEPYKPILLSLFC
jgi:hypothetical protein